MAVAQRPLTYDDLRQMPDDGHRYELIDGEIVMSAAPTWIHQEIVSRVLTLLRAYLASSGRGGHALPAPVDVRFPDGNTVEPDVVVVLAEQRALLDRPQVIEGAPALVVEVVSPSSRVQDTQVKRRVYAIGGVREYWLVDPEDRTLTVMALTNGELVPVASTAGIARSPLLPGLTVDVASLFEGLPA